MNYSTTSITRTLSTIATIVIITATFGLSHTTITEILPHDDKQNNSAALQHHHISQTAFAQDSSSTDMNLEVSDDEKITIFAGFAIIVVGIFLFLARDIILRKKTDYDSEEYASKKDRTYEKYHSEWSDDYEEIGTRKRSKPPKELFGDMHNTGDQLPNYYKVLGINHNATKTEIKNAYRSLAKEVHPDRVKQNHSNDMAHKNADNKADDFDYAMVEINKAYEVLSDEMLRKKYDAYMNN